MTDYKIKSLLHQKKKSNWLRLEDSNSKFFHSIIRWRRVRNEVKGVEVKGSWMKEPQEVREEAKRLFEHRFSAIKDFGVRLGAVEFKFIMREDNEILLAEIIEEEIKEVVWQCDGSKSPGPDGFNLNFIKNSWEYLK